MSRFRRSAPSSGFTLIALLVGVVAIALSLARIGGEAMGSAELALNEVKGQALREQALAAVRDCMARSPGPWPEAWQGEYVDTIRDAIAPHQDAPQYAVRLEILCNGFPPYWEGLEKNQYRSLFEVRRAQIRWYVEHLMQVELPGAGARQTLRDQYRELLDHAARSLLSQFASLEPNVVKTATADHLAECYRNIEVPLLPIFLHLFSQAQVDQIKERWHGLRYARVDLWQLGGGRTTSPENRDASSVQPHPDYLLTRRSLGQLRPHIWAVIARAPDYYRSAVANHIAAQKRRLESRSQAWRDERRLERERSRQLLQTEQISFLLAALLETVECAQEEGE